MSEYDMYDYLESATGKPSQRENPVDRLLEKGRVKWHADSEHIPRSAGRYLPSPSILRAIVVLNHDPYGANSTRPALVISDDKHPDRRYEFPHCCCKHRPMGHTGDITRSHDHERLQARTPESRQLEHTPTNGSHEQYLKQGSQRVLDQLEDKSSSWSCVTVVRRPHGPDAGEESLKHEPSEYGDSYQVVSLLDEAARRSIRRLVDDHEYSVDVVGPPYLLYVLLDNNLISKGEFCETTGQMIQTEGWTGYGVVKNAWASIPVDCSEFLDSDILPP